MISEHSQNIADQAKQIYVERLKAQLEASDLNRFVAIEPMSGQHFVADTFSQAVASARAKHPDRISFVIRIGQDAALHMGGFTS